MYNVQSRSQIRYPVRYGSDRNQELGLSFYHEHVRDAVLFLEEIGVYVHKIDGEKTVEEISEEILLKLL